MSATFSTRKNYSGLLLFIGLLGLGLYAHYKYTSVLSRQGFHAANRWIAGIDATRAYLKSYLTLRELNTQLIQENEQLHEQLRHSTQQTQQTPSLTNNYERITARILRHSFDKRHNFITLNKGKNQGLRPGMGLIAPAGIVGEIKAVSNEFATAYSVLHTDWLIAAMLRRNGTICSIRWQYPDLQHAYVQYLPRHINVQVGDTLFSSGYDNVFAPGIPIGMVTQVNITPNASFYSVQMQWAVDLTRLHYVYAIALEGQATRDSLEQALPVPRP